jgi:hypothetical protein
MPTAARVWYAEAFEAGTKFPRARVVDKDGGVVVTSNFAGSVQRRVYDLASATPEVAILSNTATIASVLTNTLASWDLDDIGSNLHDSVSSNDVAWEGGHTYRICYLLPHTTQGYIPVVYELKILPQLAL